jgi:pimeloyl-ACP methyl ester carboxylesterase
MRASRRTLILGLTATALTDGAIAAPAAIDETGYVPLGGIAQWVAIQGEDHANPAILYLHGGPGEAQSPFLDQFKPWQRDFTVVNWDQRGAGKTYEKNGDATPDVTLDRLADDAVALTEYVLKKLGQKKLVLVGQSAGTVLGLKVALRRPDLYYAYVASGQMVNWPLTLAGQERWARAQAEAAHDKVALKLLDETARLPLASGKRQAAPRKWLMSASDMAYIKITDAFVGTPEHHTAAGAAYINGYMFEAHHIGKEVMAFDARQSAMSLAVPYILIQGRDDHVTPTEAALAYGRDVRAPKKAVVPIEGGHFACFTNPSDFVAALRKYVLPLTRA